MAAKQENIDKRIIIPPGQYEIPSKLIESNGKSFGLKPKLAQPSNLDSPGPGNYK